MLSYNAFGRPLINDRIDFNISHSGDYVICAATDTGRVGIDIEKIRPIAPDDFKNYMTADEWAAIKRSDKPRDTFYEYWTQKESIIKANGQGLSVPLNEIYIHASRAILYDERWVLRQISIAPDYKCHLATSEEDADLIVTNVSF
jgi:4'-phosphopantetheinyl transferase